ncbi:hypothetical protein CDO73_20790 [Saccharibacillus sp. O23]|uniref:hypothetical protein n=1 Tax=Saccharibacillus sp. O23 TaxID=2009338 RepID=UPI000B4E1E02|nr:hypothetical protein [Saccharibacillus sp. O23]OWR27792.1 hypothetical protein CDO73_20790 [Saccharibacillus sp. O23]
MKIRFKTAVLGMAVVIGLTGGSAVGAAAAAPTSAAAATNASVPVNALASPDWTYNVPAGQNIESLFNKATTLGSNTYFRTEKGDSSFVVQAFDQKSGDQKNWSYDFRGGAQNFMGGGIEYGPNGDVYFLSKKGAEKTFTIRAVDAQGKLKWTKPVQVNLGAQLQATSKGDIVVIDTMEAAKKSPAATVFYTFGSDGKLKSEKKTTQSGIFKVLDNGQVLNYGAKVQLYSSVNALSKPVLSYAVPKNQYLSYDFLSDSSDYAVYPLSGGGTLIEFYEDKIEEVKGGGIVDKGPVTKQPERTLIGFDAQGKKTFERVLADKESIVPAGKGFVTQKEQHFEAYDLNNKRTGTAELEGRDLLMNVAPSGEITVSSKKDGKFYALNAADLKTVHKFDLNAGADKVKAYAFYYAGKGSLYTLEAGEKTVSHYTLK